MQAPEWDIRQIKKTFFWKDILKNFITLYRHLCLHLELLLGRPRAFPQRTWNSGAWPQSTCCTPGGLGSPAPPLGPFQDAHTQMSCHVQLFWPVGAMGPGLPHTRPVLMPTCQGLNWSPKEGWPFLTLQHQQEGQTKKKKNAVWTHLPGRVEEEDRGVKVALSPCWGRGPAIPHQPLGGGWPSTRTSTGPSAHQPTGTKQALDSRQRQRPCTAQGDTSQTPVTWL